MVLPLNLAMTPAEINQQHPLPCPIAYMACQFSPYTAGLTNIPEGLPAGSMLILNDRMDCHGHSADLVVHQLQEAITYCSCESLLLDFQRPPEPESMWLAGKITESLSVPVAATEAFAKELPCTVFLSPAPLHIPLAEYLLPWANREIWLEVALCQEEITISATRAHVLPRFPPDGLTEGFFDDALCCHYRILPEDDQIRFTLFDTPASLKQKLDLAASLGVRRVVGLWQELGCLL